ncbi:hypothetical protein MGWOODY_Smn3781 [hydrothermal vent metagenome]|uniref:Uncharacterized protein n=1 Tax=hydrothermal vent metagenome TaxID=652676 RepID=A0A160TFE9_9ZZZZ
MEMAVSRPHLRVHRGADEENFRLAESEGRRLPRPGQP